MRPVEPAAEPAATANPLQALRNQPPDAPPTLDALAEAAQAAGLDARLRLIPTAYRTTLNTARLPLVVCSRASADEPPRLLVVWNRFGFWVAALDTLRGLRWLTWRQLEQTAPGDTIAMAADAWLDLARSEPLATRRQQRLRALSFPPDQVAALLDEAAQTQPGWYGLAALEAALGLVEALLHIRALAPLAAAREMLQQRLQQALAAAAEAPTPPVPGGAIPAEYWPVQLDPASPTPGATLLVHGLLLLEVHGPLVAEPAPAALPERAPAPPDIVPTADTPDEPAPATEQADEPTAPRSLLAFVRLEIDGLLRPALLAGALLASSGAFVLQAALFRGFMALDQVFHTTGQRIGASILLLGFLLVVLLLEWYINDAVGRIGRRLDAHLRIAVLEQLPRLSPSHLFQHSTADMMERIHAARDVHNLPEFGVRLLRTLFVLLLTLVGIAWIDLPGALIGLLLVGVTVGASYVSVPLLNADNLDVRARLGNLAPFYLDGMFGLLAVRAHSAERTMRREYEHRLESWIGSVLALARHEFWIVSMEQVAAYTLVALMIMQFVARGGNLLALPLLLFWALQLATLGREFARSFFRYMDEQSKCTRFLELLATPTESAAATDAPAAEAPAAPDAAPTAGAAIRLEGVAVQQGTQTILHHIDLEIAPGSQVAIVGESGAGKSTLLGLLLGWHAPAEGTILLDGQPFTPERLRDLRRQTAWVDPLVQIWNRPLIYNLTYGGEQMPLNWLLQQADLGVVVERLPEGIQSSLGEQGRLVSGGQGQRVRLGRALQRQAARLVLLDEPFRGLDRAQRHSLLARARRLWPQATLLCATHDVGQSLDFDRVLVVEGGRIVEDGGPTALAEQASSRYRAMLNAEEAVRVGLWSDEQAHWRNLWLEAGRMEELPGGGAPKPATAAPAAPNGAPPPSTAPNGAPLAANGTAAADPDADAPAEASPDAALLACAWDAALADEAVLALARRSGLQPNPPPTSQPTHERREPLPLDQQLAIAAAQLGLEVEPATTPYAELDELLRCAGPALLRLPDNRLLLLLGATRWWVTILAPDLSLQRVHPDRLRDLICHGLYAPLLPELEHQLGQLGLPPRHWPGARRLLLANRLQDRVVGNIWLLRLAPGGSIWHQIRRAGLLRYLAMGLVGEAFVGGLYVAVFLVAGMGAAQGQIAWFWMQAALLLLLMRAPAELTRWLGEASLDIGLRTIIKQRLFYGVVHLPPDEVQQHGTGQFLGWSMESERLEKMVRAGPFLLSTLVSLLICAGLLVLGAGGVFHGLLMLGWLLLMGLVSWRSLHGYLAQRTCHHQMTRDLLERIEGHQTRLVQEDPARWHAEEDQELTYYHGLARIDDQYRAVLAVLIPYGWLFVGVLALVPTFIAQPEAALALGSSLLGLFWSFQLLNTAVPDVLDLVRSIGSISYVAPIERSAQRQAAHATNLSRQTSRPIRAAPTPPAPPPASGPAAPADEPVPLLEARSLSYIYPGQPRPTLTNCALRIGYHDRLLLKGPSGGGKSTLAALLAGLRSRQAGLLLLHGLDQPSIGIEAWRRQVVLSPQFHENHVLNASLAFNLLLGRRWPPRPADLDEATALCRELGLGDLLARMPRGLHQEVGETGWHLSHGERSRIYIARALLQGASLILLDESFGSLDPQTLQLALQCVLRRAPALLVIAHP